MLILGIIVSLIVFTIIVVIHELGHFAAARKFWVKVYEFWIWIPPKAKKLFTDKKGTSYTLNWLPIWGFVKLAGENAMFFDLYDEEGNKLSEEEIEKKVSDWEAIYDGYGNEIPINNVNEIKEALVEKNAPYSLSNKSYFAQSVVILWWVFMNFLLAFLIFFGLFLTWVKPVWINNQIQTDREVLLIPTPETAIEKGLFTKKEGVIVTPIKDSIAEKVWIKKWEIITQIWESKIDSFKDLVNSLKENSWKKVNILTKKWEKLTIKVPENWKIWAYINENIEYNRDFKYKFGIINSAKYAWKETYNQVMLTLEWLWMLIRKIASPKTETEREEALSSVSWPIGVVSVITRTIPEWIAFLLLLSAIISINLWVFNLLPIPALDWGRFVFITLNQITKTIFKKNAITPKIEAIIHIWFFAFLILLSVLIAYNDITKLF